VSWSRDDQQAVLASTRRGFLYVRSRTFRAAVVYSRFSACAAKKRRLEHKPKLKRAAQGIDD
jgi:hypothetical protein